jgi:hypothetical protein
MLTGVTTLPTPKTLRQTQGLLCVFWKSLAKMVFSTLAIYEFEIYLNSNSSWNILGNLHEELANQVWVYLLT